MCPLDTKAAFPGTDGGEGEVLHTVCEADAGQVQDIRN